VARTIPIGALLLVWSSFLLAQERPLVEEVIVTAQRVEESAQKVPIALSAFTETMIDDRQIIGLGDLQINIPNVTFAPQTAASGGDLRIRGIGVQDLGYGSELPTSTHLNEIPFPQSFTSIELYDLERVELMRGPQGTLFGRNATSGALNLVTRRPSFDSFGGYLDLEYGDYDHKRITGAINMPLTEAFAVRIAGTALKRDGYIENKAGGQIPGVDDDTDGRDYHSARATAQWQINDRADLWVMYDRHDADSSRVTSVIFDCKQSSLPASGCELDQSGREPIHPGATPLGVLLALEGAIPLGARNTDTGLQFDFPIPRLGRREIHQDGNDEWELKEEIWAFGINWVFDQWELDVTGGHQQTSWRRQEADSALNFHQVGFKLASTTQNPSGLWPMSEAAQGPDFLRGGQCDVDSYRYGVLGGCTEDTDPTRAVSRIVVGDEIDYVSLEAKVRSRFDGPINFLLGTAYSDQTIEGYVAFNGTLFDMLTTGAVSGPRLYPGIGGREKDDHTESYAVFGELYWQATDSLKVTLGLRYNDDEKRPNHALIGLSSIDANGVLEGFLGPDPLGPDPRFVRNPLVPYIFSFLTGGAVEVPPNAVALAEYYDAADAIAAAGSLPELIDALQIVPPVEQLGELRALAGRPSKLSYKEWSGRFVVDWLVRPSTLLYAKYNRGYKPGGFGLDERPDFKSEIIDSVEIGAKTRLLDDTLSLNAAIFRYWYHDLQVAPGAFQLTGQNVDVDGLGFEIDGVWHPTPNLAINFAYGWLNTELQDYEEIDLSDLRQNNPDYISLFPFDNPFQGAYVAPIADVLPLVDRAILEGGAIGEAGAPGTVDPNGIPTYFSRAYLENNGVATLPGFVVDAKGNQLPHSPEHSVNIGLAYSWFLSPGTITARWDYYWQDTNYGSIFNSFVDKIDSWAQHNASLIFESGGGRWDTRLWIRNITNEYNVMSHQNRRDRALGEPRIYGISVRYNLGSSEV
jgi:outer membrane receptor protein involved in Fe transport